ncbi:MAG: hypothetical protein KA515_02665 [Candidatus Pacebacteria bacterium]|nr:hypothetical protein [Candidatus Paceibacterota bacterium]
MFWKFFSKEKGELVLVFDIRSSSVGGALVKVQKSGIPNVIFSVRELIVQEEKMDIDRFLSNTMKSLDLVVKKIFKAGLGVPTNIHCVLSSPWHVSQSRTISVKKEKPFVFSLSLADELIKQEMIKFKEEHLEQYAVAKEKIRLIELQNIKTRLNGYETHNPLSQKVEEIEMTLFISMSPEQVLSNIENIIKKYIHFESIKFSSFTMASFATMSSIFPDQSNFLLIDVGGEVTDISMVKKNIIGESISFPAGRNFLIRGIASALSCTQNEAESYASLINAEHAEIPTEKKLNDIVNTLRKEWLTKFQESLANLSRDISVPFIIYLSADADFLHFFGQTIEAEQFNQYTLTESKFKITFLDTETLHGVALFEKDIARDPFIMIDTAFINHFLIYPVKTGHI